ncbi:MAG: DUF2244 domain-containing protein [Pseudomonadota bacterium]
MPYQWTNEPETGAQQMRLWPHQSLTPRGFVAFILVTFVMILVPTLTVLGTVILWGLLPFALLAVGAVYIALQSNYKARLIEEVLTLDPTMARLTHRTPKGEVKEWQCNRYWTQVNKYEKDGPIPQYVTLRGEGREVEIGAFLSEEERLALYDDLLRNLKEEPNER